MLTFWDKVVITIPILCEKWGGVTDRPSMPFYIQSVIGIAI